MLPRVLWMVLISPMVCVAIGMLVGSAVFGAAALVGTPQLEVLQALPAIPFYSLIVAAPFGTVAGLVGGVAAALLGTGPLRGAVRKRWLKTGATVGAAFGIACPLCLLLLGFDIPPLNVVALYASAGGSAGGLAGAAVGFMGWREFGSAMRP